MLVNSRIFTPGDLRIGTEHIATAHLPSGAKGILPLGRCLKVGVEVYNLKVAAIPCSDLSRKIFRNTVAWPAGRCCVFTVHIVLSKQIYPATVGTAILSLHRRSVGI